MPSNDPTRVVLDTSVLVAAARSRRRASHALLLRLVDTAFVPAISVPLFVEYEAVLLRSENLLGRDPERVESFLDFLLQSATSRRFSSHGGQRSQIQMTTLFLNWRLPLVVDILSLIISAIFTDLKNGESRPSRRLTSSNLLRHKHEHRNHSNA